MSIFDRLRPKWKHPDPAVRAPAVRTLTDPDLLQSIAENDPDEAVRLAAVQAITDQDVLARMAEGKSALAIPAMTRLTDHALIVKLALTAELPAVRGLGVERIQDGVTLHRIATSDTDASVRAKARIRRMGPDHTRDYIRSELSKLGLARRKADDAASFCGTLEDVCTALIGDSRFRINGGVEDNEPRTATIRELNVTQADGAVAPALPTGSVAPPDDRARFLAFKRAAAGESEQGATSNIFFEIHVWRTDQDTYLCKAEEKRLKIVQDVVEWSRVSNGGAEDSVNLGGSVEGPAPARESVVPR